MKPHGSLFRFLYARKDVWDKLPKDRCREKSLSKLKAMAYVGWHPSVIVCLGMEEHDLPNRQRSGLQARRQISVPSSRSDTFNVSFGGGLSPVTKGGGAGRTRSKVALGIPFSIPEVFDQKVQVLSELSVLLYDKDCKMAWICPVLHLIMYMLRGYLVQSHYKPSNPQSIKFKTEGGQWVTDHGEEWVTTIKRLKGKEIEDGRTETWDEAINFLCKRYHESFFNLRNIRTKTFSSNALIGVEVVDIIGSGRTSPSPYRLFLNSRIQKWSPLVVGVDLVFCNGIGDVIRPIGDRSQTACCRPPPQNDVLAAPIRLLKDMFDDTTTDPRSARRLGDPQCIWAITGDDPFSCTESIHGTCDGRRC